jgi:hypothetical protein
VTTDIIYGLTYNTAILNDRGGQVKPLGGIMAPAWRAADPILEGVR